MGSLSGLAVSICHFFRLGGLGMLLATGLGDNDRFILTCCTTMAQSVAEKGTISVHTENIFPIIKKFLYSDHEIFLRELVANAVDASQKIQKLAKLGQYDGQLGELRVTVSADAEAKTLTISDRGIGMTADEIKKYINQIAFSGATEFVEKFQDAGKDDIIGKFGLGFYSAFMVAHQVEIVTQSQDAEAPAARWVCDGTTSFEITEATRESRGTDVILHLNEESQEFLEKHRIRGILTKYAKFLPIEVEFEGEVINTTAPLWTKAPADLTDEQYQDFYRQLYPTSSEPMFWIHLNVDYPFNLTGVLYFPKVNHDLTAHRDKIQLYSRQVFITDEVKDIVPEFLTLLHGVIDSPDIPLNVSRSYLQADGNVKKINNYITKKVAEKLEQLFKNEREGYEQKWDNIGLFVKYVIVTDEKFADRALKFSLLKNTEGQAFTPEEYKERIEATQKDKDDKYVFLYTTEVAKQDAYIQAAQQKGYDVLVLDGMLDSHFVGALEQKLEGVTLKRVDADVAAKLIDTGQTQESSLSEEQTKQVKEIFQKALGEGTPEPQVEALAPDELPVLITIPEFMRRMQDMAKTSGMGGFEMPGTKTITVNANHPLTGKLLLADEARQHQLARQAYDLALLSQNMLDGKALTDFIRRSVALIGQQ